MYKKYVEKRNIKGFKGIENPYCMELLRETFFRLENVNSISKFDIAASNELYILIDWCKLDKLDTVKFGYIGKTLLPEYKNSPYLGKTLKSHKNFSSIK